ncbi:hypothetical protein F4776DRAFT_664985 [Hypoxylon sp. NC0597]|nr:hypothetical protein F4776DRAFT_664985 [Hypoxylon sp. NC0597]
MREPWFEDPNAPSNGPQANAVVWSFAALATLFLGLRVACKYRKHSQLWCDDWVLLASWILLIVSCTLVSINIAAGMGKHDDDINPEILDTLGARTLVVGSLYAISSAWSKTSFGISLLRIATPRLRILIWFLMITMNIFMYNSAVLGWVMCRPATKLWRPSVDGECWSTRLMLPIDIFFNMYSGFVDFVFAILAWIIMIKLQINLKEKVGLAIAMSMGVFAGVTAVVKALGLTVINEHDFNYFGVQLIMRDVAEIATTIIAASIPVLRTLVYNLSCYRDNGSVANTRHVRSASPREGRSANDKAVAPWRESYIHVTGAYARERGMSNVVTTMQAHRDAGHDEIISCPPKCARARGIEIEDGPARLGDGMVSEKGLYQMEDMRGNDRPCRLWIWRCSMFTRLRLGRK